MHSKIYLTILKSANGIMQSKKHVLRKMGKSMSRDLILVQETSQIIVDNKPEQENENHIFKNVD